MSSSRVKHSQLIDTSSQIYSLCSELFKNTPITFFSYCRFTRDRQYTSAMSDPSIYQYYTENNHHYVEFEHCNYDKDIPQGSFFSELVCVSPDEINLNKIYIEKFNLTHFIGVVRKNNEYCDIYTFGATPNVKNMHNFYLNNINLLEKYIDVFHEPIQKIITQNTVPKLYVPDANRELISLDFNDKRIENFSDIVAKTLNAFNPDDIKNSEATIYKILTERELDCLRLITRGLTSKEIARDLTLSFRTVENYCERLKIKLNCRRKQDIIARYSGVFEG